MAGTSKSKERQSDADLLNYLQDDAAKWAAEFCKIAIRLGYSEMDEGWLIGWFANAIEYSQQVRVERGRLKRIDAALADAEEVADG